MISRKVRTIGPTRSRLAAFLLAASICVSLRQIGAQAAHRPVRKTPRIEIKLSGPKSIRPDESLETLFFQATLTNRSAAPQLLFVREGYLMNALWTWTASDANGQPLGMALANRVVCGTSPYSEEGLREVSRIHDTDLFLLAPGESREFSIPQGPSDDYNFPTAGAYRFAVTLTYVQPNATSYFDEHGKAHKVSGFGQWDLSQLSADSLLALRNSLSIEATSSTFNLVLPKARPKRNATFFVELPRFDHK